MEQQIILLEEKKMTQDSQSIIKLFDEQLESEKALLTIMLMIG
jgi:hypothetical protein